MRAYIERLLCLAVLLPPLMNGMSVTLRPSFNPPGVAGQVGTWKAGIAEEEGAAGIRYRFRVRLLDQEGGGGGNFQPIRDFSSADTLERASIEREGAYEFEVNTLIQAA